MAVDLAALAREREQRNAARPRPAAQPPKSTPRSSNAPRAGVPLLKAHRSTRMAHAIGLFLCVVVSPLFAMIFPGRVALMVFAAGCLLARTGAAFVHSLLPDMLREGAPPNDLATSDGLFNAAALENFNDEWAREYENLLECLAFACTYGKQNCLTNDMYSGDLTLGKIWTLVSNKLRDGVIRCD